MKRDHCQEVNWIEFFFWQLSVCPVKMADLENGGEHVKTVQILFEVGPEPLKLLTQTCRQICTRAGTSVAAHFVPQTFFGFTSQKVSHTQKRLI